MATPKQTALSQMTEKEQRQVNAAIAAKKAGKPIGPNQRNALKKYNELLKAAGGKPRYGIGAGKPGGRGGRGGGGGGNAGGGNAGGGGGGNAGNGNSPDSGEREDDVFVGGQKNPSGKDILANDAMFEEVLRAAGFTGTLDEMKRDALVSWQYGGLKQYIANLSGSREDVRNSAWMQNVGMTNDENAWLNIVNQITGDISAGKDPSVVWGERYSRMTEEMPYLLTAYDKLVEQGIPFSVELLADPSLNLTDPNKPLFDFGTAHPTSLDQLTGFQAGEEAYYAGLTAEELLTQVYPLYSQYYNRPAGTAPPDNLAGGLTFGGYNPVTGAVGGAIRENPSQANDLYMRAMSYGMLDPEHWGRVGGDAGPFGPASEYYPLLNTGTAYPSNPNMGRWSQALQGGEIQPGYFYDEQAYNDLAMMTFGRIGMAAFTGDPSYWFAGQYAPYANIDEATRNRYSSLMGYY